MIDIYSKSDQASGAFNGGEIVENKPIGFPSDGGKVRPFSSIFYWANAVAKTDSTIGLHPHQGFEIMSFVLEGRIRHFDTQMNDWKPLDAGDVQIIRAGNGISHAEHMEENSRMFQIWFDPNLDKTLSQPASYDDYKEDKFPVISDDGVEKIVYKGEDAPIQMDTAEVGIERWKIDGNSKHSISSGSVLSLYVLTPGITIGDKSLEEHDFMVVQDEEKIELNGQGELFVISSPANPSYPTYAQRMSRRG